MKHLIFSALLVCTAAIGCTGNDTKTTDTAVVMDSTSTMDSNKMAETPAPMNMPDSATMMKNWQEYMTPGEPHKLLASWDGTWTGDITMWMAPGAPPQVSKATAVNSMMYGGRYQMSKHTSSMMGMPFEGQSIIAYDNIKKKFVSTWVDNMGTGIIMLEGPWDEASKTLTLSGKSLDPMTQKEMTMKETMKMVDQNTQFIEMFGPGPDGKDFKMMEIKMTRK